MEDGPADNKYKNIIVQIIKRLTDVVAAARGSSVPLLKQ